MGRYNNNGTKKAVKTVNFLQRHRHINKAAAYLSNTRPVSWAVGKAVDHTLENAFDSFRMKINVTIAKNLITLGFYLIAVAIYHHFNNLYVSSIMILVVYAYMGIRFLRSLLVFIFNIPGTISNLSDLSYCWRFKNNNGYFREITIGGILLQCVKAVGVNAILLVTFGLVAGYVKRYLRKQVMRMYLHYLLVYPLFDSIDFLFGTHFMNLITVGAA